MCMYNTSESYGWMSKVLHWIMALIVMVMIGVGLYMTGLPKGESRTAIYATHKAVGIVVFLLLLHRFTWHFISPTPGFPSYFTEKEKKITKLVKYLLYLCLFIMPVSGYLMSSFGGHQISFFSLIQIPMIFTKNEMIGSIFKEVHYYISFAFIIFIALHVAGSLKHHFIVKDDALKRMSFL